MKFSEIKQIIIAADTQALDTWNADTLCMGHRSLEDMLTFVEHRRSLLAGTVALILTELIAREESHPVD